jgi:LysM repeat protein
MMKTRQRIILLLVLAAVLFLVVFPPKGDGSSLEHRALWSRGQINPVVFAFELVAVLVVAGIVLLMQSLIAWTNVAVSVSQIWRRIRRPLAYSLGGLILLTGLMVGTNQFYDWIRTRWKNNATQVVQPQFPPLARVPTRRIDLLPVAANGRWGMIDRTGLPVIEPQFDSCIRSDEAIPVRVGAGIRHKVRKGDTLHKIAAMYGVTNSDLRGHNGLEPRHKLAIGQTLSIPSEKKWGYVDQNGKFTINPLYRVAGAFQKGLAAVSTNLFAGFIGPDGRQLVPEKYAVLDECRFCDKSVLAMSPEGMGFLTIEANTVAFRPLRNLGRDNPYDFSQIANESFEEDFKYGDVVRERPEPDFFEGLRPFLLSNEKIGYIDTNGTTAITGQYDEAMNFSGRLAGAMIGNRWGFINHSGLFVVTPRYERVGPFSEGLAPVRSDGVWGFIDSLGNQLIANQFEEVGGYSEGLARVKERGYWGYIDSSGTLAIPFSYVECGNFRSGRAAVNIGGENKWTFIDKAGTQIVQPQFEAVGDFVQGLALVRLPGLQTYIDTTGRMIWVPSGPN